MKIAIIPGIFFPEPGGAQCQTHNLSNKLVEKRKNIDVLINKKCNLKNNNYKIIKLNNLLLSLVYFFHLYLKINISFLLKIYLKSLINKNKYDIWHFIFLNFKSLILINSLKDLNQKIIVTFQGADIQIDQNINYGYRLNINYNKLFQKTLKNVDLFFSISENIKNDILNLGVSSNKIILIPNTVEINKINQAKENNTLIKKKKFNLITVARYAEKKKGFDLIEEITKKLIDRKINFVWTFVGKNTHKIKESSYIKNHLNYFDFINNIENLDEDYFPHSKLINKYFESDLYLNLARIESFGITFVESLACDLPIISFKKKGVEEIVIDKKNGFLITNNKIEDFIDKINYLYKNQSALKELKMNCKETVLKFDNNLNTDLIIQSYKNLLNDKIFNFLINSETNKLYL